MRPQQQPFVQAAQPVALQIERDVPITDRLELAHDRRAHVGFERPRKLVAADLHARELVVMPHAADAESQARERLFGALDRPELLVGDFRVVRNARRQAGRRRLVPRRQARFSRQLANLVLERDRPRRADCARRIRGRPAGRDDSRRDRRRCCRRRRSRRARRRCATDACTARACSSSSDWTGSRGTRAARARRCE